MGHHHSSKNVWTERYREALTTHQSHEDVLKEGEFESPRGLSGPAALSRYESRFICLLGGRLCLRAGKFAHFRTAWVD